MLRSLAPALALAALAAAGPAAAGIVSDDGVEYDQTRNAYGVVLRAARETIYLGESCDVLSDRYGEGKWANTPEAVILDFVGRSLTLAPAAEFVGRDIPECRL